MKVESPYRTHYCNELRGTDEGKTIKLAGWVTDIRLISKNIIFITMRDHYGKTQLVFSDAHPEVLAQAKTLRPESVIFVDGVVKHRGKDANLDMETGEIEVVVTNVQIDSLVENLPFQLHESPNEELRLKYRFIDLRRDQLQKNIRLRFKVMQEIRNFLAAKGFLEIQTPILTASSPEGARDFVVPSRMHPGKFYALPQAPQQYKQLLMCSGIDKYFQIAPCFRDEDARADRSPGEFYQLDMEMAFITQDELFLVLEEMFETMIPKVTNKKLVQVPFPRIKFADSMEWYGNDKPDIRFDMKMKTITHLFKDSGFKVYKEMYDTGKVIKAFKVEGGATQSRKFYDNAQKEAKKNGAFGIGWLQYMEDGTVKGSIVKPLSEAEIQALKEEFDVKDGDSLILCAGDRRITGKALGQVRVWVAGKMGLLDDNILAFCWIVDFPMYEEDEEEEGKWDFCHNPFSMPQGGMEALDKAIETGKYEDVYAYQYDIVCNGIELSSGAIRNHRPDIMYKAFEVVGYSKEVVDTEFGHMISAFKYGAPPHGGIAPGLDRMVMIFADEPNIREVIAFPMNQRAQDPMMGSPAVITQQQLDELSIAVNVKEEVEE
ncbi:MAG: aspartate--tRNA ligase [Aureispira sp.]|nr:aspartate--tRNA ligase [Aureispira sp.]